MWYVGLDCGVKSKVPAHSQIVESLYCIQMLAPQTLQNARCAAWIQNAFAHIRESVPVTELENLRFEKLKFFAQFTSSTRNRHTRDSHTYVRHESTSLIAEPSTTEAAAAEVLALE